VVVAVRLNHSTTIGSARKCVSLGRDFEEIAITCRRAGKITGTGSRRIS
tara:strand:+ start:468 stop:614 length:147 start_codon:yes stop_codon:yes gene_type:complete